MDESLNTSLNHLERTLQVVLEAICSLAKEITGKSMVVGRFDDDGFSIGATPLSNSIKWVTSEAQ